MTNLELAILFHETYERLAPSFGYETRPDTKLFDPESKNGRLMVAVCGEILARRVVEPSGDAEDVARWQFVKEQMNYSFDGENRTHYMKAEGRETFEETVDRRRGSSENRTCSDG